MVDFIEEVEEQLRSERYLSLAKRALPWFVIALAAVVIGWLGVWAWRAWENRNVGQASITYDRGVQALEAGDQTGAYDLFGQLGKSGPAGYRSLALMQEGNIRFAAGKNADAAAFYDAAAKAAPNTVFRNLARFKAALSLMDTAPYPQLQVRLRRLIGPGKPFDLQAREALAMAKLAAGRSAEARADLTALTLTLGVSDAMKARDETAISLIDDHQAALAPQAARAAATLPPVAAPTAVPGGDGGTQVQEGAPAAPSATQ